MPNPLSPHRRFLRAKSQGNETQQVPRRNQFPGRRVVVLETLLRSGIRDAQSEADRNYRTVSRMKHHIVKFKAVITTTMTMPRKPTIRQTRRIKGQRESQCKAVSNRRPTELRHCARWPFSVCLVADFLQLRVARAYSPCATAVGGTERRPKRRCRW